MGLFDSRKKEVLAHGIDGSAVILESIREGNESANQGEPWPWEIGLNRFGTRRYRFKLEVRIAGREPYVVQDRFKVPRRAENISFFNIGRVIPEGLELPVRVDPNDTASLQIDWEKFLLSPGRKHAMQDGTHARQLRQMKKDLDRKPELAAKLRENNRQTVHFHAAAVRSGNMSREEFERTVEQEVAAGRMDPADAEAGRNALAEPVAEVLVLDAEEAARIRREGRKTSATVLERTDTGQEHRGGPVHRLRLDVETREIVHHEVLNDRWAAILEPGMQTTVYVDPLNPQRIALG